MNPKSDGPIVEVALYPIYIYLNSVYSIGVHLQTIFWMNSVKRNIIR